MEISLFRQKELRNSISDLCPFVKSIVRDKDILRPLRNYLWRNGRPRQDVKLSGPTINSPSSWPRGVFAIDRKVSQVNTVPA